MTTTLAELKQIGIVNALRSCQLFAGISLPELNVIADITSIKPVAKGSYLFHEGETSLGFYIVQTGAINVHRVNAAGKEQVIHVFRAGESFAEGTLATDKGYPADARAVEPSQVLGNVEPVKECLADKTAPPAHQPFIRRSICKELVSHSTISLFC